MSTATIFLDYDGTLHDTMRVYGPAFRAGYAWLVEKGYKQPREFEDEWISHWLGWTIPDMWNRFAPDLPQEVWLQASHVIGAEMERLNSSGKGGFFKGIPEALDRLRKAGYTLVVLSNGEKSYFDSHRKLFGLDRWISYYHCAEDMPGLKKWEMYLQVADNEGHPLPHVMVGDRRSDLEVSLHSAIPFIGCSFGFGEEGELAGADKIVDSPSQLFDAIQEVLA